MILTANLLHSQKHFHGGYLIFIHSSIDLIEKLPEVSPERVVIEDILPNVIFPGRINIAFRSVLYGLTPY